MSVTEKLDLKDVAPGIDVDRYYDSWRMLLMLWRGMWNSSRTDWSRYRRTAWPMFNGWCVSAARRARDLSRFLSNFARLADIPQIGTNEDERAVVRDLLGLPEERQRAMLRQIRSDMPVLSGLVRRYQQIRHEERSESLEGMEHEEEHHHD